MRVFHNLRLRLAPPRKTDPDFGPLLFMFVPNAPERSYWECEWAFPPTGTKVSISLRGSEKGPDEACRSWYLGLPRRFDWIMAAARPSLEQVFRTWMEGALPSDIFTVVKLAGFSLEDPKQNPITWSVVFETTGEKWLGITIPFAGDEAQEAIVDT